MSKNTYIEKIQSLTLKKSSILSNYTKEINSIDDELVKILNEVNEYELSKEIQNKYDLTKTKDVVIFLQISRQTLKRFRDDGRLRNGIHYEIFNNRIKYIPQGIIQFNEEYTKYQKRTGMSNNIINVFEEFELRNSRKAS